MINIGVIGCGYWGPNLIRNFMENTKSAVVAVCDKNPEMLKAMKQKFDIQKTVTDYREMINDPEIQAVVISTPASTHYQIAKDCINAGKDILVEKPLTTNSKECEELTALADKKGVILMVGHVYLFHPAVRKIKELIDSGALGKVSYIKSFRENPGPIRGDVNCVWDLAPHDIAMVNYFMGSLPRKVQAVGSCYLKKGVHDMASVKMGYDGGVDVYIRSNWMNPISERLTLVFGDKKSVLFNDRSNEKLTLFDTVIQKEERTGGEYHVYQNPIYHGSVQYPRTDGTEPLKLQTEHFLDCVKTRAKPLTDGINGAGVVRVLEAIDRSLKENTEVEL